MKKEFISAKQGTNVSLASPDEGTCPKTLSELDAEFLRAITGTFEHTKMALQTLYSPLNDQDQLDGSQQCISSWGILFDTLAKDINLEHLCDELLKLIASAVSFNSLSLSFSFSLDFFPLQFQYEADD